MIVRIVPVVSKQCSDDRDDHLETLPRQSQTTRMTETNSIAWIELSSIRTIGTIVWILKRSESLAIVWVAFPYDRPDRLNIFWDEWDDPDDSDDHMKTRLYAWSQVKMRVSRDRLLISIASRLLQHWCNPPDIKCISAFREKAKLYFGRDTENRADYFSRCVNHSIDVEFGRRSFQFAILWSRDFFRHSNLRFNR